MKEYNAFNETVNILRANKNKDIWRWSINNPVDPSDYQKTFLPSYYDAPYPNPEFVLDGPLTEDGLRIIQSGYETKTSALNVIPVVGLNPSKFSLNIRTKNLFDSEHRRILWPEASSLILTERPDFTKDIEISTYGWDTITLTIVPINKWKYSPDSNLGDVGKREWKLSNLTIQLPANPVKSITTKLYPRFESDTHFLYLLPEFPVRNLVITEGYAYSVDQLRGIIFIDKNLVPNGITLDYDAVPLCNYVPESAVLDYTKLFFMPFTDGQYFITLSSELTGTREYPNLLPLHNADTFIPIMMDGENLIMDGDQIFVKQ